MKTIIFGCNIIDIIQIIALLSLAGYDIYLAFKKRQTISQRVHNWTGKWGDIGILTGGMIVMWWIGGPSWFIPMMWGVVVGHLFWYKEE